MPKRDGSIAFFSETSLNRNPQEQTQDERYTEHCENTRNEIGENQKDYPGEDVRRPAHFAPVHEQHEPNRRNEHARDQGAHVEVHRGTRYFVASTSRQQIVTGAFALE
jgi:hypothetical protein